jgi:hypothetical protein
VIGQTVQALLEKVGMVIDGPVATAIAAQRLARAPQVSVVEVKLKDGMAYGLIDRLHDLGVRVVVFTGFAPFSTQPVRADAILQKPCGGQELLTTLCGVLAGTPALA